MSVFLTGNIRFEGLHRDSGSNSVAEAQPAEPEPEEEVVPEPELTAATLVGPWLAEAGSCVDFDLAVEEGDEHKTLAPSGLCRAVRTGHVAVVELWLRTGMCLPVYTSARGAMLAFVRGAR